MRQGLSRLMILNSTPWTTSSEDTVTATNFIETVIANRQAAIDNSYPYTMKDMYKDFYGVDEVPHISGVDVFVFLSEVSLAEERYNSDEINNL